jgi:peptidoglycan biosynthesis protein MviN/MurJ (putative lipid II flippase)
VFKNNFGIFEDIYNPLLETLLNLFISLVLVKPFGINGVLIGTVLSNLVVVYYFKPLILYKKGFNKEKKEFFLDLFKWFLAVLVISGELYLFVNMVKPPEVYSWTGFVKNVIIYSLMILTVLGVNFWAVKDFREFIRWVRYED